MVYRYQSYLFRALLAPTVLIALALTGIVWLAQSLRFVDLIVGKGLPVSGFFYLSALLLPSLFGVILPVALFAATLYRYNQLIMDSEILVLHGAGVSRMQVAKPALFIGVLTLILGYFISFYALPYSYREFKETQNFIRHHYASLLLQEQVFNTPVDGLTVFLRDRSSDGMLRGILVHDSRSPKRAVTMMAEEGRIEKTEKGPRLVLIRGNRQEVDQKTHELSMLYFEKYGLDLSLYVTMDKARSREAEERYLPELLFPEESASEAERKKFKIEVHKRLSWPMLSLMLTSLALAALLSGEFNRRGQLKRIAAVAIFGIIYIACQFGAYQMAVHKPFILALVYGAMLLIFLKGLLLLREPRRG